MTGVLGDPRCPMPGCRRMRHVSPGGIHYGTCLTHADELLARAFGPDPSTRPGAQLDARASGASPRSNGSDVLQAAMAAARSRPG